MKKAYVRCLSVLLLSFLTIVAYAQKTVTGTVTESSGALPGVSILVKGTNTSTQSDPNGKYSISAKEGATLVFSFVGFESKEVIVGASSTLNVKLEAVNNSLNEVVVTALGIKREKKSLGYAVQEVKGETLVEAREPNVTNALVGKVAGLQILKSSNGPAGSAKINLRGNNSLTGDNQPLIVVDGIPMNNTTGSVDGNNDFYNPGTDMGNGLSDINPEDIASMSVLKGPAASALYGSRGGNGVILITTKTGKPQKGLGISVSSTVGFESIFTNPKSQSEFGQGDNDVFISNPESKNALLSWGPKITGQTVKDWRGKDVPLTAYDNVGNYLQKGVSSNQSVSFQQQVKSTSVYTSFNRLDDKSIIPGTSLHRTNLTARTVSKFGADDRWTVDAKVQYINSDARNRPTGGINYGNIFATLYQLPRTLDIRQLSDSRDEDGNMIWYNSTTSQVNPYWSKQYALTGDIRNRYLLNGSVKYNFNSWLNAEFRGGADKYLTTTEGRTYAGSALSNSYSYGKQSFSETNFSAMISGQKDNVISRFGGLFTFGGNLMHQQNDGLSSNSGTLEVPDLFALNNGQNPPTVDQVFDQKKINSVYGSAGINWDGYLFLDGTFRNDWTSTLSPGNRSYFYPSVSLSYVVSDMFTKMGKQLPNWLTYAKLRGSYASVGNDLAPYQLYNTYNIDKDPNGGTTASRNDTFFDPNVKNELIKSYEAGLEMRFFKSRVGLDVSIYKSNATNQLVNIPLDALSGYNYKIVNVGNIQNTGVEVMVDANVLNNPNSLNWNLTVNYSHNNNFVKSLGNEISAYSLGGYDRVQVFAIKGQKYGEIYGDGFKRVEDPTSPLNGQLLLDENGLPLKGAQDISLGNQQANSLLGLTNSFAYKGFNLSFLIDGRFGGKIFSSTLALMQYYGTSSKTVVNGSRDLVVPGAILNTTTNQYEQNTKTITQEQYQKALFAGSSNLGITEANLYDASNIRIRNINLSYNLPTKFLGKTPIQGAKIGVSCNNVWLISSHMNGLDPESIFATNTNATGFENSSPPTTRTYSLNLSLGF